MRILLLATSIVVLATPALSETLSGNQIRSMIVGNTMSGVQDGVQYEQYLNPSGTIFGDAGGEDYGGRWKISGNQVCFMYGGPESTGGWDCSTVTLRNNQIIFEDGTTATLKTAR